MVEFRSPNPKVWVQFLAGVPIICLIDARLWDSYFLHTEDKIGSMPVRAIICEISSIG